MVVDHNAESESGVLFKQNVSQMYTRVVHGEKAFIVRRNYKNLLDASEETRREIGIGSP